MLARVFCSGFILFFFHIIFHSSRLSFFLGILEKNPQVTSTTNRAKVFPVRQAVQRGSVISGIHPQVNKPNSQCSVDGQMRGRLLVCQN